eukprot:scaffold5215_cov181-Amphora_coffeaeformis.AAC.7
MRVFVPLCDLVRCSFGSRETSPPSSSSKRRITQTDRERACKNEASARFDKRVPSLRILSDEILVN